MFNRTFWIAIVIWLILVVGTIELVSYIIASQGGLQCVLGHFWNAGVQIAGCK